MTTITLSLSGEKLAVLDKPVVSSGDVNTVSIELQSDSLWEGFTKTIVIYINEDNIFEMALVDNKCVVPQEILAKECNFYVGVRGVNGKNVLTSTILSYKIVKGAPVGNATPVEPTSDVYQQIIDAYGKLEHKLDTAAYVKAKDANEFEYDEDTFAKRVLNLMYPVGSIYMSVSNASPSDFIGGTWEAWGAGRVPVGVDSSNTNYNSVEKAGGSEKHNHTVTVNGTTLTVDQIPSHSHNVTFYGSATSASSTNIELGSVDTRKGHAAATTKAGGGKSHTHTASSGNGSTIQPYITCYMWKRTA